MKTSYLASLAGLALALAACSNEDGPAPVAPDPVVIPPALSDWQPVPLRSVAEANVGRANGFALDLFKKTMASGEQNLFLSPVSVFAYLTITTDNGMEFRNHEAIGKDLGCIVYFADPFCSGQKGGGENINKIFRQFCPKGTDFRRIIQKQLNQIQFLINERHRK